MKVGSSWIKMCSSELEGEGQERGGARALDCLVQLKRSVRSGGWRMEIDTDSSHPTFDGDVGPFYNLVT